MLKISDVLEEILTDESFLRFGLSHQLLNLSQTAKFIKPLIETRLQKEIQVAALVMALSRLQKQLGSQPVIQQKYEIDNISVQSGLATLSFSKTGKTHDQIHECYKQIHKDRGYFVLSEGNTQITLVTDRKQVQMIKENVTDEPFFEHLSLSALSVAFGEEYLDFPGMSYQLFQKLTLQNINLIEYASTCTEVVFFLSDDQIHRAFETLHGSFGRR